MNPHNCHHISGRLMEDPQLKHLGDDKVVCQGLLSVRRSGKPKANDQYPPSDVFRFEVWGISGEAFHANARKGAYVSLAGEHLVTKRDDGGFWHSIKVDGWTFAVPKSALSTVQTDVF